MSIISLIKAEKIIAKINKNVIGPNNSSGDVILKNEIKKLAYGWLNTTCGDEIAAKKGRIVPMESISANDPIKIKNSKRKKFFLVLRSIVFQIIERDKSNGIVVNLDINNNFLFVRIFILGLASELNYFLINIAMRPIRWIGT